MRILTSVIGLTLLSVTSAWAALPPQYQRQAELLAILNSTEVVDAFGFEGIDAVFWVGPDQYQVRGGACVLDIAIKDAPNTHEGGWAGPREFELVVGEAACSRITP